MKQGLGFVALEICLTEKPCLGEWDSSVIQCTISSGAGKWKFLVTLQVWTLSLEICFEEIEGLLWLSSLLLLIYYYYKLLLLFCVQISWCQDFICGEKWTSTLPSRNYCQAMYCIFCNNVILQKIAQWMYVVKIKFISAVLIHIKDNNVIVILHTLLQKNRSHFL